MIPLTPLLRAHGFTEDLLLKLEDKRTEGDYWPKVVSFVEDLPPTTKSGLSRRQHNWLAGILEELK